MSVFSSIKQKLFKVNSHSCKIQINYTKEDIFLNNFKDPPRPHIPLYHLAERNRTLTGISHCCE